MRDLTTRGRLFVPLFAILAACGGADPSSADGSMIDGSMPDDDAGPMGESDAGADARQPTGLLVIEVDCGEWAHTCALIDDGRVRCWGSNMVGQLGYPYIDYVGDDDTPVDVGDVGVGGTVVQVAAGNDHTCALLETGAVRCWGSPVGGVLGYGDGAVIGDDEAPAEAGDVDVGGRVTQIAAGSGHTCALLDSGAVRCWGAGSYGAPGLGTTATIGDDETPASVDEVDVGGIAVQISAGSLHTCALLDTGAVRCWGDGTYGALGYGSTAIIGDDEAPESAGEVNVGGAVAQISAGGAHTCAVLESGAVRCWGQGDYGALGYGNTAEIGDDESPASAGDVNVGGPVAQISAGFRHTCAVLQNGAVRCWGNGSFGRLGYGNEEDVGNDEAPASAGDVNIGGTATQVSAGGEFTCALISGAVRCWGQGGALGRPFTEAIGDDEPPSAAGFVPII